MGKTRTDSFDFGEPNYGGVAGDAMRARLASSMFDSPASRVYVGRFELIEEIGAGGMGVVHRAHDPGLSRDVAIKLVHAELTDAGDRERLLREAKALAKLNHPNVVTVYEAGEHDGQFFIAMEFVPGKNAEDWASLDTPSVEDILQTYRQAGCGLDAAHHAGIVHRDFKPANVLIGSDGRVRVADFGLAQVELVVEGTTEPGEDPGEATRNSVHSRRVVGTPAYMAPEQWAGRVVTTKSDQFAFCVALWETLTGSRPYPIEGVKFSGVTGSLPAPREQGELEPRVRAALLRGLHDDPDQRWPDMASLLEALELPRPRRWPSLLAVGLLAAGVAGTGLSGGAEESTPCEDQREQFAAAWNDGTRAALASKFAQTTEFGARSWSSLEALLDTHHGRWINVASDVCPASDSLGFACLQRSAAQRATLLGALESADAAVATRIHAAAAELSDPKRCEPTGSARLEPIPLGDEVLRSGVSDARRAMAKADVLATLGEIEDARASLDEARAAALASEFEPVVAETHCTKANIDARVGDHVAAASSYRACLFAAQRAEHEPLVVRALAGLVRSASWNDPGDPRIDEWRALADATLPRVDDDKTLARAVGKAALLEARLNGEWDDATARASALIASAPSPYEQLWARGQRAMVRLSSGDIERARDDYGAILEEQRGLLGDRHPDVGLAILELGRTYDDEPVLAEPYLREALQIFASSQGRDTVDFARAATVLALNLTEQGKLDEAHPLAEEAARVQLERQALVDAERTSALSLLVEIAQLREGGAAALDVLERLLEEIDPVRDPEAMVRALNKSGFLSLRLGRFDDAAKHFSRLLSSTQPTQITHLYALSGLAQVAAAQQECPVALAHVQRVEALLLPEVRADEAELLEEIQGVRTDCTQRR